MSEAICMKWPKPVDDLICFFMGDDSSVDESVVGS